MNFAPQNVVESLRKKYTPGTRVELVKMDSPYNPPPVGTRGTVLGVDAAGDIFIRWDNGPVLKAVWGVHIVKIVDGEGRRKKEWMMDVKKGVLRYTLVDGFQKELGRCIYRHRRGKKPERYLIAAISKSPSGLCIFTLPKDTPPKDAPYKDSTYVTYLGVIDLNEVPPRHGFKPYEGFEDKIKAYFDKFLDEPFEWDPIL